MRSIIQTLKKWLYPADNPVIVKELRTRMRGPRAFATLTMILVLMGIISYALYQLILITSTWITSPLSPQIGQTLFYTLLGLEMAVVCAVTPAVTAGAVSSEHERLTYEILVATPLHPVRILWGKLISALGYVFLLIFAAVPMASLVFIFGGVSLRDLFKGLLVILVTAIMLGVAGIFFSTWLKRTARATLMTYVFILTIVIVPAVIYGVAAILQQGEPPRWLLIPSPVSALFSAISPSSSLGSPAFSLFGGVSMLLSGNLGVLNNPTLVPRPLYHYTLPLYALLTLVLYLLASRLIRPTRRWHLSRKDWITALLVITLLFTLTAAAFGLTMDRYENAANAVGFGPFGLFSTEQEMREPGMPQAPSPIDLEASQ